MSELPDDILEAAKDVADKSACASWDEVAGLVAAALMAERERCAKVAEQHGEIVSNEMIGKACSRNIAAAIRLGNLFWKPLETLA